MCEIDLRCMIIIIWWIANSFNKIHLILVSGLRRWNVVVLMLWFFEKEKERNNYEENVSWKKNSRGSCFVALGDDMFSVEFSLIWLSFAEKEDKVG